MSRHTSQPLGCTAAGLLEEEVRPFGSDHGDSSYGDRQPVHRNVEREFAPLDAVEVDGAVRAADEAFHGWRRRPIQERAEIVRRAGELVAERKERFARLVTLEMGKLIGESEQEVDLSSEILVYYVRG